MALTRREAALLMVAAGTCLFARPMLRRLKAQEQAPGRPEFTLVAKDYRYSPDRIEVAQDDLVKLTIRSEDVAYSFAIDEYRIVRRVPAGGSTTFEFRADRPGTFRFYSNLTNDAAHAGMQGQLVVRPR
ncbi:MAG: cupredoxin domain-containing protein [Acidobacteria bacterium]|nr:cupredoxin domain-containing protein [Acidobacteriota bacterium]